MNYDLDTLRENYIREFKNEVDWRKISESQQLSHDFIGEFQDYVNWYRISQFQKLSEPFIRKFKHRINWTTISTYQKLSELFIREFQDKVNWIHISCKQKLSESFIREFKDKIYVRFLLKNENQKYYSAEFIFDFAPLFNYYYKFNVAVNVIRNHWLPKYYKPGNAGHLKAIQEFDSMLL